MRDIHPHWDAEEERPVEVKIRDNTEETREANEPQMPQSGAVAVSRRPAAIVGMLLVLGIGFSFFKGVDNLKGQVAPTGPTVRITSTGMVPASLNVEHGQTITFVNDTPDQHRIESGTLCSDTGYCLQTGILGPGDTANFSITVDMRSGSYEYASGTSAELRGSIVIVTQTADDFTDLSSILQESFMNQIGQQNTTVASEATIGTAGANTGVARNPYTVGSDRQHPFDTNGSPIPEAFGDSDTETVFPAATSTATQAENIFSQTRGPVRQPQTGAEHWIVIALSIGLLWRISRHHFATVQSTAE